MAAAWPLIACFGGLLLLDRAGLRPAADAQWASVLFLAVLFLAFGALLRALRRLEPSRRSSGRAAETPRVRQEADELPVAPRPHRDPVGYSTPRREEADELPVAGVPVVAPDPRHGAEAGRRDELPVVGVMVVALLLRLLALPLAPSLSDDVHRYLWDGRVAASGANPYRLTPNDPELTGLRDDLWQRTAHRDVATVYPPLALGLFAAASVLPQPLAAYKLALAAVDLIGCLLLLALARRRGSTVAALAYVWNPLVVIEGAGMGHVDVMGTSLVIACVFLLPARHGSRSGPRRSLAAGAVAALGVLAKLVPFAAVPLWWRTIRRDRPQGRLFAIGAACLLVPATAAVLVRTGGLPPGLVLYALRWEYNGPLHEPLWRLLDVLQLDRVAAGLVHVIRLVFGGEIDEPPWQALYSRTYPAFLSRILLLAAGGAAWLRVWRTGPGPTGAAFAAFGIVLLASPTLYPWYLTWILPWAALLGVRGVLLLSATLPLAYLPALAGVDYFPWVYGAIWLPPLLLFAVDRRPAWRRVNGMSGSGAGTR